MIRGDRKKRRGEDKRGKKGKERTRKENVRSLQADHIK